MEQTKNRFMDVLTTSDVERIIETAHRVLAEIGVKVQHPEALEMLKRRGAEVDGELVKVKPELVREAVAMAPKGFVLYNRDGEPICDMTSPRVFFGTSTASPRTRDAFSGEYRPTVIDDIAKGARVADALPGIDWVMPFGSAQDVPQDLAEIYEFEAVVNNTKKPVVFCGYSAKGVRKVYEMAAAVVGGLDRLKEKPFVMVYPEPITPLTYPYEVVERMMISADLRQPQLTCGCQQPGATAPITYAGLLVQGLAESLFSIMLAQFRQPGAPVFMAMNLGGFNMNTGIMSINPPEASLGLSAQGQIARHYGFPSWGLAGASDSKALDAQAGAESGMSLLAQAQAGLTFIHDVGYLDMGMACSLDMLVLGDELIGWVRRCMAPIEVNDDTLAFDEIASVGPGGNYLKSRKTLKLFRQTYWMPDMLERSAHSTWVEKGSLTLDQKVNAKVKKILSGHQAPALPDSTQKALKDIIKNTGG